MVANLPDDFWAIPLGRPGTFHEVSAFVLFLVSDESSYATGTELGTYASSSLSVAQRMTSRSKVAKNLEHDQP